MIAGRLKHRVELLQPIADEDRFGAEALTYRSEVIARAERVKMTGRRLNEVGEHFGDLSVQFNVRSAHKVAENWRLRVVGEGTLYTIVAVLPNLDRGYNTLICERVNE